MPDEYTLDRETYRSVKKMDREQLQKLLEEKPKFGELSQHANESIGLKNINARIRLYYGEDYGLSVKSEQGCGTTVQIKIPELAEETKEEA